ncbi:hypothetical protein, partial [Vibrio parahaemolyticus]
MSLRARSVAWIESEVDEKVEHFLKRLLFCLLSL